MNDLNEGNMVKSVDNVKSPFNYTLKNNNN